MSKILPLKVLINKESFVLQDDDELVVSITVRGPFLNPKAMKARPATCVILDMLDIPGGTLSHHLSDLRSFTFSSILSCFIFCSLACSLFSSLVS